MSKYTITIKNLIDNNFDFGLQDYPIFKNDYRNTLNQKILNHYYMSEIGFETAELFKFYLNNKMNEIMPYYNTLYDKQNTLLENLENNISLTEIYEGSNNTSTNSSSTSTSTNDSESKQNTLFQDTPQSEILMSDIEDQRWATEFTQNKNEASSTIEDNSSVEGEAENINNYTKTIQGNTGGKYNIDILNDIKNNFMNIDLMIINDLDELFMGIF